MTKFDLDATPECDELLRQLHDSTKFTWELSLERTLFKEKAYELERRVRVAEEKLRIAMEVLTTSCVYDYTDVQTALKEIYEVDP